MELYIITKSYYTSETRITEYTKGVYSSMTLVEEVIKADAKMNDEIIHFIYDDLVLVDIYNHQGKVIGEWTLEKTMLNGLI